MIIPHTYGASHQPALVLLHPGGALHSVWQPFIRAWGGQRFIIAPDLFVDLAQPQPLQAVADELILWLDDEGLTEIELVGSSLGANIALYMAIQRPSLIRRLVLDSGQSGTDTPPKPLVTLARILRGVSRRVPPPLLAAGLMTQFRRYASEDRWLIFGEIMRLGRYGFVDSIEAHFSHHVTDRLHHISAPTLILEGAGDTLTKQGAGKTLQQGIASAQRITSASAGHVTCLRQPQVFQQHVAEFLHLEAYSSGVVGS